MKIKAKQTKVPYTKEEKIRFYQEGMIRTPTIQQSKKQYNRKSYKNFAHE